MKVFLTLLSLLAVCTAVAQTKVPPIPVLIILYETNSPGPITLVHPIASSWSEDSNHQTVFTNLTLTCMTVKSLATKRDGDGVLLFLRDGTRYEPAPSGGNYANRRGE